MALPAFEKIFGRPSASEARSHFAEKASRPPVTSSSSTATSS